jgi:hypothetical protein
MLRGLVGSYGHLLSPGWSGCGEGGVRGSLRMTGVGGVVVGKSKKQRQGQYRGLSTAHHKDKGVTLRSR